VLRWRGGTKNHHEFHWHPREALALVVPEEAGEIRLLTDEHKAYPRALRDLPGRHFIHEQTSSKVSRVPGNPRQPVNRLQTPMDRYYWGREPTRQIPNARAHALMFSF
jgi:hypothetical protein